MCNPHVSAGPKKLLVSISLIAIVLDPLMPALTGVITQKKSDGMIADSFEFLEPDANDQIRLLAFLPVNILPLISIVFGGIAARKYESKVGAFCCGCGTMVFIGRAFYFYSAVL